MLLTCLEGVLFGKISYKLLNNISNQSNQCRKSDLYSTHLSNITCVAFRVHVPVKAYASHKHLPGNISFNF